MVRAGRLFSGCARAAVAASLAAATLSAQQTSQPASQQPVFRSGTRLIVTTVSVKDKDGRPVEGLTAKDFIVSEDNQPQDIAFVEYQRLAEEAPMAPLSSVQVGDVIDLTAPAAPAVAVTSEVPSAVQTGIAVPQSGDARFRDRRLIILYFDLSATPEADRIRAFDAGLKYIATQMTPADLVAIMTFTGGAGRVKQDFTDNPKALYEVINVLIYGEDKDGDGERDQEDPSSAFGQNDQEFNVFNTDRQLSALQTAVTMLRPLPEQKSLVFFTSNLR